MADQEAQHASGPYALLTVFVTLVLAVLSIVFTQKPTPNMLRPAAKAGADNAKDQRAAAGSPEAPLRAAAAADAGDVTRELVAALGEAVGENTKAVRDLASAVQDVGKEVREWREEARKQREEEAEEQERGQMRSLADDLDFR